MKRVFWLVVFALAIGMVTGCEPAKKEAPKKGEEGTPAAEKKEDPVKDEAKEPKADEAKTDEAKTDEAKTDEAKTDEAKTDEAKPDEAKPDEAIAGVVSDKGSLTREEFNRMAVRLNLPLYWISDKTGDGVVAPDEVVTLRFYPTSPVWALKGAFTPAFEEAYAKMVACKEGVCLPEGMEKAEFDRRALVMDELDQGRSTLIYNDLTKLSDDERAFVRHMAEASALIDELYRIQTGAEALKGKIAEDDHASQSAFRRNWGPKCLGPKTETIGDCRSVAEDAYVGVYPAELQKQENFCETLSKHELSKELTAPFTVVVQEGDALKAVPYSEAFGPQSKKISETLKAAAQAIGTIPTEAALKTYLESAAQSFVDNNWEPTDEAWAKMNATNSRWYVRVGPDETYWEPCSLKAGYHLTFALINTESLEWQKKLDPVRQEMEDSMAALIGAPYEARTVAFHLPDFIDIVTNSGDDRDPFGATIGQSLPNWGPVANEGRGRTVAMSNLYTDPDSLRIRRLQAESLLHTDTMGDMPIGAGPGLLGTILHEAAHNLGPAHEYKIDGKKDDEVFGGRLATIMEELKAQTAALWYVDFLLKKGLIDEKLARQSYADSVLWALGHISRGVYTADGRPKPYSQLAAIQIAYLIEVGAVSYDPEGLTANGKDKGVFKVHFDKMPEAVNNLMRDAGQIKAKGDKAAAEALIKKYVDGDMLPYKSIKEKMLRHPKASFVYAYDV